LPLLLKLGPRFCFEDRKSALYGERDGGDQSRPEVERVRTLRADAVPRAGKINRTRTRVELIAAN
jgi:hypothetical protein